MASPTALGQWMTVLLGPNLLAIVVGSVLALGLPVLVHYFLYRPRAEQGLPTFLVAGPSGSGKTTLATYLEQGSYSATHTSQVPLTVEVTLPTVAVPASSRYRSSNDPTLSGPKRLLLVDTPGHGKLRYIAMDRLAQRQRISGVIYVVDAADLSEAAHEDRRGGGLQRSAEYLHDILLLLQKQSLNTQKSRGSKAMPVLIVANKLDLFTALPTPLVRTRLEAEISRIRESRAKGLLDSGIGVESATEVGGEKDILGEPDSDTFRFSQMASVDIPVNIAGGYVIGADGPDVQQWWQWMADQM